MAAAEKHLAGVYAASAAAAAPPSAVDARHRPIALPPPRTPPGLAPTPEAPAGDLPNVLSPQAARHASHADLLQSYAQLHASYAALVALGQRQRQPLPQMADAAGSGAPGIPCGAQGARGAALDFDGWSPVGQAGPNAAPPPARRPGLLASSIVYMLSCSWMTVEVRALCTSLTLLMLLAALAAVWRVAALPSPVPQELEPGLLGVPAAGAECAAPLVAGPADNSRGTAVDMSVDALADAVWRRLEERGRTA